MRRNEKPVGYIDPEHPNRKYYQCYHCGKPFWKPDAFRNRYCCLECFEAQQKEWSEQRKKQKEQEKKNKEPYHKVCKYCGKEFDTTYPQKKYCCKDCLYQANLKQKRDEWAESFVPKKIICKECGTEFITECGAPRSVFCCDTCANRHMRRIEHNTSRHQAFSAECNRKREKIIKAAPEPVQYKKIYARDKGICQICGLPVSKDKFIDASWGGSIDHIVPLSVGGKHEMSNCQLAHRLCNSLKCKDTQSYSIDWEEKSKENNHWRLQYEKYKKLMSETPIGGSDLCQYPCRVPVLALHAHTPQN